MNKNSYVLGIDVGSVSISVAAVDRHRNVAQQAYEFHRGRILACLQNILSGFDISRICGIASTSSTPSILNRARTFDNRIALIEACRLFHAEIGSILLVGGEKFGLIQFDAHGNYQRYKANTSCAAGTGSFLDQQAERLNLNSSAALSEIAMQNRGAGFSLNKSHPNVLAAAKRPFHTIIPGFLMDKNKALGPFGVMGGFMQPQGHTQVITGTVDYGLNPQAVLDAPRWQVTGGLGVDFELGTPEHVLRGLAARGHEPQVAR